MFGDENSPGIIPQSLKQVFRYISETEKREFLLRVSYMEIYKEVITDLLKPKHTNLKIHENTQKDVFVGDLTEEVVTCVEEIIALMKLGEGNKHFGSTNMNERSSRSHTIFRIVSTLGLNWLKKYIHYMYFFLKERVRHIGYLSSMYQ